MITEAEGVIVVVKRPGWPAMSEVLPGGESELLAAMQDFVDGYIESAIRWAGAPLRPFHDYRERRQIVVYVNDEGRICDPPLPVNFVRPLDASPIHGNAIAVAVDPNGATVSMTEGEVADAIAILDLMANHMTDLAAMRAALDKVSGRGE